MAGELLLGSRWELQRIGAQRIHDSSCLAHSVLRIVSAKLWLLLLSLVPAFVRVSIAVINKDEAALR